jgi:hypothetical protein
MSSAEDFRNAAQAISTLAAAIKPADLLTEPYAQERKLIQYHLNVAAGRTKAIAEALERKERSA